MQPLRPVPVAMRADEMGACMRVSLDAEFAGCNANGAWIDSDGDVFSDAADAKG